MIERSPGTKTRRSDSPDDKSNKQSTDSISNIRKRSKISCQSQLQDISQLNAATMECESFETLKSNFINSLDLCKYETYRNNDRCFRIFLLATKFLSDANAMKMFNAFYSNKMFLQLSDFYICWTQRCRQSHNIVRSILIKAERMDAKPKCAINIQKRQFAIKEEELILSNNDNKANSGITQTIRTSIYPWDIKLQAELMNYMQVPNFIKFYNRKMPPFNFMFDKLSFPKQTSNDSLNYICSIKSIPDRYFILKIRPKHQSYWEAYIYHYVKEELRLISGIVEIYHCLTFIDKCLTVQEFTAGTLKELINIQNFDRTKKLNELIIAIIILDLMKILRCIHQMNIIHGCFRSDNIFIAKRLICKPQLGTLNNGTTLILKLANWDFAIRDIDGRKYDGQYINENKVITDDDYKCEFWNYEIDRLGFVNIVNELICNQTMCYLQCKNNRYVPLLNLKRNWSIHDYWYDLIHKCLDDTILHSWDELINDLADVIDIFIRTNGDQWIKFIAEYNLIFLKLLKRNSQFYP